MSFCQSCFELKSPAKPGGFMLKKTSQIVPITFEKGSLFDAHTALRTGNWVSKKEKAFSWLSPFLLVYSEPLPSERRRNLKVSTVHRNKKLLRRHR